MLTDEQILHKANMLRQSENGEERARQYLDQMHKAKEQSARRTLGQHWSEKSLEEMKQRDWRILKENYGIATKGGTIPNPLRSWEESDLPRALLDIVAQVGYKGTYPHPESCHPDSSPSTRPHRCSGDRLRKNCRVPPPLYSSTSRNCRHSRSRRKMTVRML